MFTVDNKIIFTKNDIRAASETPQIFQENLRSYTQGVRAPKSRSQNDFSEYTDIRDTLFTLWRDTEQFTPGYPIHGWDGDSLWDVTERNLNLLCDVSTGVYNITLFDGRFLVNIPAVAVDAGVANIILIDYGDTNGLHPGNYAGAGLTVSVCETFFPVANIFSCDRHSTITPLNKLRVVKEFDSVWGSITSFIHTIQQKKVLS